ncbi:DgaE family pyridoxal phosphate-dependent ammonia lyase [Amphibacillus sp. Q70]|uniref:DgaE family pyridoxal phosphate-dependent ammonia lyase n=1 Tax=Amphibacillus sp. Q70 TaxID=3453416 RepID=UPI003F865128
MENVYQKYKLKKVINASGKMTILGVSRISDEVSEVLKTGSQNFFEMKDLIKKTGTHIANLLEVEDAVIVSSASAGIAQSVAAIIGKGSQHHLYHPFDKSYSKRKIVLPKGHNVDYGTPIELMINLGGGKVVEAGYSNMCSKQHIELMIDDDTAAIMYVKSHHSVQKNMLNIKEAAEMAKNYQLPLIVDAAAEEDLVKYYQMGADIVIYSGAKAVEGPSSGIVLGKTKYINWVRMQANGIGRSMKIGKESILGIAYAIEQFLKIGSESGKSMICRLKPFITELEDIEGLKAEIVQDSAGRDIYRAKLIVKEDCFLDAKSIVDTLKAGFPAIYTREYEVNNGIIEFDIRSVSNSEIKQIVNRIMEITQK